MGHCCIHFKQKMLKPSVRDLKEKKAKYLVERIIFVKHRCSTIK